jgi:hypothetical protein
MAHCRGMRWFLPFLALAGSAQAETLWLKDAGDLTYVMIGREFAGIYANGAKFMETYRKSGVVEYSDGNTTLTGKWSMKGDVICMDYEQTGGHSEGCFRIAQFGNNCIEYWPLSADGKTLARTWIARGWRSKDASTCAK